MQPTKISQTGVGSTTWVPMDRNRGMFRATVACEVVGTATYTVENTNDDVLLTTSPAPVVFPHPSGTDLSANTEVFYTDPTSAIRITVTAGTGTVNATILQTGLRDG